MHSGSFIISGERNSQVLTRDLTQGGNTMDTIGITVAVIGIIVSTATIVYALWNLFDMLAAPAIAGAGEAVFSVYH